jgi:hypothetical protein
MRTMTILLNSWAQDLKNLAGINEANSNMTVFTNALALTTTLDFIVFISSAAAH